MSAEAIGRAREAYEIARGVIDRVCDKDQLARQLRRIALRLVANEEAHGIHEGLAMAAQELQMAALATHASRQIQTVDQIHRAAIEASRTGYVTPAMARAELEAGK